MPSYYELWTILNKWKTEFTTDEFTRVFSSPNPRKVLHDMSTKGLLEHVGYGEYKVRTMDDYVGRKNNVDGAYDLLRTARLPYALTEVDGVFVWTKGGYNADRFFGFYPIHISVLKSDIKKWETFLENNGKRSFVAGTRPRETLFGVFYILHPKRDIEAETVERFKVERLEKTVNFCKENIYTFEPALEILNEEYNLGLRVDYNRP
jgi:hypothetical protein